MFDVNDLKSIKVGLASPEKIREWSHGEVTKPETINYRSQKPEMDGLFCEKIFGPSKDYECHCGKYKKQRYIGVVCEKCGVEVISREVRRERMGHIELATPCSHIWYLKGVPSRMALVLGGPIGGNPNDVLTAKQLEEVIYFNAHICLNAGTSKQLHVKKYIDERNRRDLVPVLTEIIDTLEEGSYERLRGENLRSTLENSREIFDFFGCANYIYDHTGAVFGEGGEAVKELLHNVDLEKEFEEVSSQIKAIQEQKPRKGSSESQTQKLTKLTKRLEVIDAFIKSGNKPEWMILDALPVIPPDLRPMLQLDGGRFATSDLNDLYRRVITRNNRLKKLIAEDSPYVIIMNEKRMVQEAVDALIDNGRRNNKPVTGPGNRPLKSLSGALKGKQGRFRQNLLGKRVDYSGRSVIAVGPSLRMYQCGLPREMAINLLRPFIASILINDYKVGLHRAADAKIDARDEDVLKIVEEIISEHPVLLNRAPTLHRLGIQAFQPVLVEGHAIRLHPLVCTGFNADFDGDQMAVHVPLGKAAQEEALNLMLASNNILAPKDGKPIVTPSQDMLIGNYYLTLEADQQDFENKAKKYEVAGDLEEAQKYRDYAKLEGKVFKDINECYKAYLTKNIHLHTRVALPGKAMKKDGFTKEQNESYLITTVGKMIFNLIFPSDFPYINEPSKENLKSTPDKFFVKRGTNIPEYIKGLAKIEPIKKKNISQIIDETFHRYGSVKTSAILDKIKDLGFQYSTISGLTIAISDINVLPGKEKLIAEGDKTVERVESLYEKGFLTEDERHKQVVDVWTKINDQISDLVSDSLKNDSRNPLYIMSDSGARGSKSNFTQLMGMRGLMGSTSGETIELPVKSCFREGLNVAEFFTGTHGARKGGADTALKTADSGYLTRRLVDVSQDVIVREVDCHTDHGSLVSEIRDTARDVVIVNLYDRLVGRFSCHDVIDPNTNEVLCPGNTLIDEAIARKIVDAGIKQVEIRSLFGCETKDGVCVHCYGRNLATGQLVEVGEAIGIMAAQSIGEPGTQLTMRTFHSGGVAGGDITQGLPRVQELFEARNPKGVAKISEISGYVTDISEDANGIQTVTITNDLEEKKYQTLFGSKLRVKKGDYVKNGGKITEGAISPKELLNVADVATVQRYIIKEVQKVYRSQSIEISDKHIEVIVRQMLRKVAIIDGGDTEMIPGTRVSVNEFTRLNNIALMQGKRPAICRPLILGITKAALETDSFLSAASFQETTRVLTDAAIKGKIDTLHGLKENVITGKLIPAGRGLNTLFEEKEILEDFDVLRKMKDVKRQYLGSHDKDYDRGNEYEHNLTIEEQFFDKDE